MDGPIIEVKNLSKKFGTFEAVKDVSFTVNKGDVFGFLGPNGAGKSTTIRCIDFGFLITYKIGCVITWDI